MRVVGDNNLYINNDIFILMLINIRVIDPSGSNYNPFINIDNSTCGNNNAHMNDDIDKNCYRD